MRVRFGSVVLLILGLIVIVTSVAYVPGPAPVLPLLMFGTGLIFVLIGLLTLQIKNQDSVNKAFWSHTRIGLFLVTWNIMTPFYVVIPLNRISSSLFYAALWAYIPPSNPLSPTPLVLNILYTLSFLPFYATGFVIAWLAWKGAVQRNIEKGRFVQEVLILQWIHILIIWLIIPCPISSHPFLCLPTPTTGLMALMFRSKVVEEITTPWIEQDG